MSEDTGRTDMEEMTLDLLREIRDRLASIEDRQEELEKQLRELTQDVHTVHEFQKTFAERLSSVEQFCVERPLRTKPSTPAPPGEGR